MLAPGAMPEGEAAAGAAARRLLPIVLALFFTWGLATVLVDIVTPKLKSLFALSYAEATLTQFAFFIAYAVVSLPAGLLVSRIGYMRGLVLGLLVMTAGCVLFAPAARAGVFPLFLLALFVMASGIAVLQVAANPLVARLGAPERASSRLTLAQTFNALGTTVGPAVGAWAILGRDAPAPADAATASPAMLAAARQAEAAVLQGPFLAIAAGLFALAILFWSLRGSVRETPTAAVAGFGLDLLARPRLALGALALFLYVGAEVSIGTLMVSYLEEPHVLGADPATAGHLLSVYWGGALAGRIVGSLALRHVRAGAALAACAVAAGLLVTVSALSHGSVAAWTLLTVGLANAILFPTIFAMAIEGLGDRTAQGSGIVCVAIVGGAIVPVITGTLADHAGLGTALGVPVLCYLCVAGYGLANLRTARDVPATGPLPA
ncbi:sugar MFS transporter [Methylobacterium sp. HMF5984]|uniref:sugar MFS transporter n=1 Tax=Methylobacterium sp. HMF5984 TaxID=3367370 RepID=UPI0038528C6D